MEEYTIFALFVAFFILFFIVYLLLPPLHKKRGSSDAAVSASTNEQNEATGTEEEQYILGPYGCVSLLAGLFIGFIAGAVLAISSF